MELAAAGLKEQPFRTHGKPLVTFAYRAWQDGLDMLEQTCRAPMGLSLLQGPKLSGKSTLIATFTESIPEECSVAVIDGSGLNTTALLQTMLRQFGYALDFNSTGELLAMTRVFALQQASSHEAPIVIIENAHALNPSALRALCELAELRVRTTSAIKLVLSSDRPLAKLVVSDAMQPMARRLTADFHLRPMTCAEAQSYLYAKLRAAGSDAPEFVFPASICTALWQASGGWPGILDRIALLALARAQTLPVGVASIEHPALPQGTWDQSGDVAEDARSAVVEASPPTLYITRNGKTLQALVLDKPRLLVGRSEHNDLAIDSRFISRHHMLLVRSGETTFLMDLNSTNGTFVNSRRVSNHVLVDDDVIAAGHHRIKFSDPHATERGSLNGARFADTAIMHTLEDMRALLARENTELLPSPTENLPTLGNLAP